MSINWPFKQGSFEREPERNLYEKLFAVESIEQLIDLIERDNVVLRGSKTYSSEVLVEQLKMLENEDFLFMPLFVKSVTDAGGLDYRGIVSCLIFKKQLEILSQFSPSTEEYRKYLYLISMWIMDVNSSSEYSLFKPATKERFMDHLGQFLGAIDNIAHEDSKHYQQIQNLKIILNNRNHPLN